MDENEEYVSTGNGNNELGEICSKLFQQTGQIGYFTLGTRVSEPAEEFDKIYPQTEELSQ